jgi:sigma-E factor negative regulatory protein RseC
VGRVTANPAPTLVEEQARVVAVGPGLAWVETQRRSACGSCPSSTGCATPVLGRLAGSGTSRLQVDDHLGLKVGELVVIGIPEGDLTRAAVLAYLLPPAALVLAAGGAGSLGAGDLGSALAGVLGLVLGLLATRAMTGGTAGQGCYRPVLVRRHLIAERTSARPRIDFTFHQSTRGT